MYEGVLNGKIQSSKIDNPVFGMTKSSSIPITFP